MLSAEREVSRYQVTCRFEFRYEADSVHIIRPKADWISFSEKPGFSSLYPSM